MEQDLIADISEAREKFFGCAGKMLIPSRKTVEALLEKIPANQLVTTEQIQKSLAIQFKVQVTCPVALRKALQAIARDSSSQTAFWRVVKKNGELMSVFPGGLEAHVASLKTQGFSIDSSGKKQKIENLKEYLVQFNFGSDAS